MLDSAGIAHAGAGSGMGQAAAPSTVPAAGTRVAVISLTDNEPEWEAINTRFGINYIRYTAHAFDELYPARVDQALKHARELAPFVHVSARVGPNWRAPT